MISVGERRLLDGMMVGEMRHRIFTLMNILAILGLSVMLKCGIIHSNE